MLCFGEYFSNNVDSQTEERAHQEAVLDSLLVKNEILGPARAQLTLSLRLISIICEHLVLGVVKKKNSVESVGLPFGVLFYSCRAERERSRR